MQHRGTPKYRHDCARCQFLGHTIGGGIIHDLYLHPDPDEGRAGTLVARYSDEDSNYYSTHEGYAHATGHAELFAAQWLAREFNE